MTSKKPPIAIKKYANRRLYHTGTSTYVTLDDLAVMVKRGEDFVVSDAKSGDDITRSVLAQIIFEQEGKSGQNLLPVSFLRQLIGFYGDSMQSLVPTYLEHSIKALTENQQKFRDQFATTFPTFGLTETQVAKNMDMFRQSLSLFNVFVPGGAAAMFCPSVLPVMVSAFNFNCGFNSRRMVVTPPALSRSSM